MKFTQVISTLALAAIPSLAAPTAAASSSSASTFEGQAIRKSSSIQYSILTANGTNFYLNNGNAATYTPPTISSSGEQDSTIFLGGDDTLSLSTRVPGGQQVYVDASGELKFTVAHSADMGTGSSSTGFSVSDGEVLFEGLKWVACPIEGVVYQVYAAAKTEDEACEVFSFTVKEYSGVSAYEYV